MSDPGKAVFLSYASQDAEAAKRICDALRQSGVEVWFDAEGGLEHGDEWDAKIRRQIKECVLFLPIISANTQAREEGYFRIEWELAAQRALGIASGVAFILPIVIDDTREPDALVPDRFRSVQWTRLRGGELTPEVKARFLKLWSHRAGVVKHQADVGRDLRIPPSSEKAGFGDPALQLKPGWKVYAGLVAAVFALVAAVGWWMLRPATPIPASPVSGPKVTVGKTSSDPAISEARTLVAKARAMFDALDGTRDDYRLAEELIAQAKAKDATDAEVCAAEAQLHERFLQRGWDTSDARRELARAAVQRAIRLDPQSFEARFAQAFLLGYTGSEGEERTRQLRLLRRERPTDQRILRALGTGLDRLGHLEEAISILDESAALPGGDPLALYTKSQSYWWVGRAAEAEAAIEAAIAQKPFTGALLMNVWYKATLHGDLDGARALLNRINPAELVEDRACFFAFSIEWLARQPEAAIARLAVVPRDWLNDSFHRGPKGLLVGDAQQLAGRPDAAALEWRAALKLVDQRLAAGPNTWQLLNNRFSLLVRLGQREEAERVLGVLSQLLADDADVTAAVLSRAYTRLGRKAEAISQISTGLKRGKRAVLFTAADLRLNPGWDPLRGEPAFSAVIAEAEAIEKAAAIAATPARDWPKDVDLKRALKLLYARDAIAEDFALAEDIVKPLLAARPNDPDVATVAAVIAQEFLTRGFDTSEARRSLVQRLTERAAQLAPDDPVALAALGRYLAFLGAQLPRAEKLLRRAIELSPDEARYYRTLLEILHGAPSAAEPLIAQMSARFPRDTLVRYDIARYYKDANNVVAMEQAIDETLVLEPLASAMVWKCWLMLDAHGDVPGMKASLDRVPERQRAQTRVASALATYAEVSGQAREAGKLLNDLPASWLSDFDFTGPKALLLGNVLTIDGRPDLARMQYEAALAEVKAAEERSPTDLRLRRAEMWALLGLGRRAEALATLQLLLQATVRPYRVTMNNSWWHGSVRAALLLDQRTSALELLREAADNPTSRMILHNQFNVDPRMAPFRSDPEILAALAGQEAAAATPGTPVVAAVGTEPKDPDLKRAIKLIESSEAIASDVTLAEDLVKGALAAHPTDPAATVAMGRVQVYYLVRGFDRSEDRFATAKRFAERGLALAPDDPEAMVVMATYLYRRGVELPRATKLLRAAIARRPAEPLYYRMLDNVLSIMPDVTDAEVIASAKVTAERFPTDVLVQYELARHYRDSGMLEEAEHYLDIAIKLGPVANAIIARARLMLFAHGDPAGMKALLDQLPERYRGTDRAVFSQFAYALVTGQPALGLDALQALPEPWMIDFDYTGPTALLAGELLLQQGKAELARLRFTEALTELGRHKADFSRNFSTTWLETWLLMRLGRLDEARKRNEVYFPEMTRPYRIYLGTNWWFNPINLNLLLGEHTKALALMREAVGFQQGRTILRNAFRLDPRMAPFRDDPEIKALLAEPVATGVTVPIPTAPALTPARELARKALALVQGLDATREDFALAEDFCQRALKLDSTDGEVWAAYAQLNAAFGYRGWDSSPERREQNRVMAERAIRLAPDSAQAKLAQAGAWTTFNINRPETEKLIREVVAQEPDNQPALRFLAVTMLNQGKLDECLAINERSAALPGGDPLALFNNARYLWQRGRPAEGYAILQRSLAQKPFSSSLILKTIMEITWRGDLAAAAATLQQIPQSALLEDRANYTAGLLRFYQRHADQALEMWGSFPRDYYSDFVFDGPKGLLIGLADELDHREAAAKIEWRTALQLVEKRIAATPNKPAPYYYQAYLLACLGEKAAAGEALRTCEQLSGIKYTPGSEMTYEMALIYVRLGRLDEVFAQSHRALGRVKLDPRMDALRADPRYAKLLAENERKKAEAHK